MWERIRGWLQAKSRNDKNISGLLNQIEDNAKTGKIGIHTFTNASAHEIGQTKVKLISIQFASSEETICSFAQVVVDVAADPVERSAEAAGTVVIPFPGGSGGTGSGTGGSDGTGETSDAGNSENDVAGNEVGNTSGNENTGVRMMSLVDQIPDPDQGWFGGFCGCVSAGEVAGGRTGGLSCGL